MKESLVRHLEDFVKICYSRLDIGEKNKGNKFQKIDLYQEIIQELADIANYAFLEYVKIQELKSKKDKLLSKDNSI